MDAMTGKTRGFTAGDLRRRASGVLAPVERSPEIATAIPANRGDFSLNPALKDAMDAADRRRPAAVLVPVVDRGGEATVLLTQRPDHMSSHAGQISFPGGKMEPSDRTPAETALREAHEEIGLEPHFADVLGFLEPYQTSTGFRIAPAVAIVRPDFSLKLDPREVDEVFEVPLGFLMSEEHHELHWRRWQGSRRYYYAMPYGHRYIWGATAGIIRNLYEWLYR